MERHIAVDAEMFSQNRRINHDYHRNGSTNVNGDGIYAEYTYNGDKQELYEDVYGKLTNTCHVKE